MIIDFNAKRQERDNAIFETTTDEFGVTWYKFACEFQDGPDKFAFDLWARDHDDAERRLGCLKASAAILGKISK